MSKVVASLEDGTKTYNKQQVLDHISLDVSSGKILGLIGPSGSGKTTTIKCLMGMETMDEGSATIFDTQMPNRKVLSKIGYMGQTNALYENLSARENLVFFGNLMGLKGKQLETAICENMALVHLEDKVDTIVNTFSGGMKRRLSLAITLLTAPELLILDEPSVGIDPSLRRDIWKQLSMLTKQGRTVIITTHVMDEAERCDEVGLIVDGRLFALGTPSELKAKFGVATIEDVFIEAEGR